jgi:hypothetical protein
MQEHDIVNNNMFYAMTNKSHPDNQTFLYPSLSKCVELNNDIKKDCQQVIKETTSCINHKCPTLSHYYGQFNLIGTLKDDNLAKNNHVLYNQPYANGEIRVPKTSESSLFPEVLYPGNKDIYSAGAFIGLLNAAGGDVEVKSRKILLFKIKKNKIQNLITPSTNSLTFIDTPATYSSNVGYPESVFVNTYIGAYSLPNKLDTQRMVYPTESVGAISCTINPEYIKDNRLYKETFDYINDPERFLLRPNSESIIWQNEIKYRSFISNYPNKINGSLMEYDIFCYGENNPYFFGVPIAIFAGTAPESYKDIKRLFINSGDEELYEALIIDDGDTYSIKCYLIKCGAGLCYEFAMSLGGANDVTVDYELSPSASITDIFLTDPGCGGDPEGVPNPPDPDKYMYIKLLYSFTERKPTGARCVPCPEHFYYCDDVFYTYESKVTEVDSVGDPPWPVKSKSLGINKKALFLGSRESCIETDEGVKQVGGLNFSYIRHPKNYDVYKMQSDYYLAYPINCEDLPEDYRSSSCDCEVFVDGDSKIVTSLNGICKNTDQLIIDDDFFYKSIPPVFITIYNNIITIQIQSNTFYIMRKSESKWLLPKIEVKLLSKNISI